MEGQADTKRYYPQPAEQNILAQNITRYFSYPERSPERSTVAAEVSQQLRQFSDHWTHRAVRLWFTNNKNAVQVIQKATNPEINKFIQQQPPKPIQQLPPIQPMNPIQQPPSVRFGMTPNIPRIIPISQPQMPIQPIMAAPAPMSWSDPARITIIQNEFKDKLKHSLMSLKNQPDSTTLQISSQFDKLCADMHSQGIFSSIDLVKPCNFPIARDPMSVYIPDSPNPFGISRPPSTDPHSSLWQQRANQTTMIGAFDCAFNGPEASLYIKSAPAGPERSAYFIGDSSQVVDLKIRSRVEACAGNAKSAFVLSSDSIIIVDRETKSVNEVKPGVKEVPATPSLSLFLDGCVCGFGSSSDVFVVQKSGKFTAVPTGVSTEWSIAVVGSYDQNIVVGFDKSPTLRLYDVEGRLVRVFVGHTEPSNFFSSNSVLLASVSDDKTAKLWDKRSPQAFASFSSDRKTLTGVCLSDHFLSLGVHDRRVCTFDLRNGQHPVFGVVTDDYSVESPYYDEQKDLLKIFGIASRDGNSDSLLFIDDSGTNNKYIYRKYSPFLSEHLRQ